MTTIEIVSSSFTEAIVQKGVQIATIYAVTLSVRIKPWLRYIDKRLRFNIYVWPFASDHTVVHWLVFTLHGLHLYGPCKDEEHCPGINNKC